MAFDSTLTHGDFAYPLKDDDKKTKQDCFGVLSQRAFSWQMYIWLWINAKMYRYEQAYHLFRQRRHLDPWPLAELEKKSPRTSRKSGEDTACFKILNSVHQARLLDQHKGYPSSDTSAKSSKDLHTASGSKAEGCVEGQG